MKIQKKVLIIILSLVILVGISPTPDICPDCGAKLENVDEEKEEEKKTKENVK